MSVTVEDAHRRYTVETERQTIQGEENWYALIRDDGREVGGSDGDSEVEAITIAFCGLLGNLPSDFPRDLIDPEELHIHGD